ncbi:Telomere end binding protein [Penicillium robsamsonii]|uniref:Telomere end binding protein n=1 Tax=Penicillium robsamsonii TaxID=1792511 RepID=UPI0025467641|nr:Telomere end binding protein [Penicillium robsamsonii]KAJ5812879.1 Telomere end binding protein [Penicillium robsamsonii]
MAGDLLDITTARYSQGNCNVLGVVVDTLPLFRTRGSSACVTFTIKDSDFDAPTWRGGLKVKYFNDNESHLPDVKLKDVVLLRNIQVTFYQNKPTAVISQHSTVPWVIFRPEPSLTSSPFITSGPIPFEPTLKEKDQAQSLLDRVSTEGIIVQQSTSCNVPVSRQPSHVQAPQPASHPVPKFGGLPYIPIHSAKAGKLCQLLGQVVTLNTYDSQKCLLYLTDFTENEELVNYKKPGGEDDESGPEGDRFNYIHKSPTWPGPWGKLTIEVTLWEPHATYAREHLKAGDVALLTYVRIKECRRGLEAAVHEDRQYPEKIHVRKVNGGTDERVQELMNRRTEYWKIHGEPKTDTKKAKKKNKKAEQKKEARKEEGQLTMPAASRIKLNPHVKTKNYTVPNVPLEKILLAETHLNNAPGGVVYQLPFQNVTYHSQVRVVDFFPPRIEDFAVQTNLESQFGWEWRFCLLVEGVEPKPSKQLAREVMKLYVSGQDGDFLLDDNAFNLRDYPSRLEAMKEKLFLLWGNLEEEKSNAMASGQQSWGPVKSRPFECCIKEYGVRCTHGKDPNVMDIDGGEVCAYPDCFGWERRFAMFGTTIHT